MNDDFTNNGTGLLMAMANTMGVSGCEKAVTSLFERVVSPYVDNLEYDNLGNLIAHKKGNGQCVMVIAHADEIGFIVKHIDESGFVYVQEVGGMDINLLPGRDIAIYGTKGEIMYGVIGKQPIHLQEKGKNKDWECDELWVDIGMKSREEAMQSLDIGCYASFIPNAKIHGNNIIESKALDDRCGLAVLAGVAKELSNVNVNCDLFLVCSVQEELGARGVHTAAEYIQPDIAIAIDVTHATDYPSISTIKHGDIKLGAGAVVAYGPNIDRMLNENLIDAAKQANAKIQKEVISHPTGTDINPVQIHGRGVRTALLSIPCRYMHTPVEMVSIDDVKSAINIITKYITF